MNATVRTKHHRQRKILYTILIQISPFKGFPENLMTYFRITVDPHQMGGVPCIRGLRIPVATVVGMIAEGMSEKEILEAYPDLEPDDIREALQFAAEAVRERELPLRTAP